VSAASRRSPGAAARGDALRTASLRGSVVSMLFNWKSLLGIAISLLLLYLAFRKQDLRLIAQEIRAADPLQLAIATALATFIFWVRAWRWRSILQPVRPGTSFRSRFAGVTIGAMGNNLLPARVGEFARAYAFSRMEPVSIVAAFSSLVIERLFDGVFLVAFLFLAMVLPGFPGLGGGGDVIYVTVARSLVFLLALAFGLLFLMVLWPERVVTRIEAVLAKLLPARVRRPIIDALEAFLAGVSILRDPTLVLKATIWSAVLWLINALGFWFAFRAFDIDLPVSAAIFFQSCLALAVSVPSGPAFVGLFEGAALAVLGGLWGISEVKALAFGAGFHIAGFIPVTLLGLWFAYRLGLSLAGVARTEEVVEEAVERETGVDPEHPRHPPDTNAASGDGPTGA
jgi:uncharacterized protein (TIRG00374 family)